MKALFASLLGVAWIHAVAIAVGQETKRFHLASPDAPIILESEFGDDVFWRGRADDDGFVEIPLERVHETMERRGHGRLYLRFDVPGFRQQLRVEFRPFTATGESATVQQLEVPPTVACSFELRDRMRKLVRRPVRVGIRAVGRSSVGEVYWYTSEGGHVQIPYVASGLTYRVVGVSPSVEYDHARMRISPRYDAYETLEFGPAGFELRLYGPDGRPAADVPVRVQAGSFHASGRTDGPGGIVIRAPYPLDPSLRTSDLHVAVLHDGGRWGGQDRWVGTVRGGDASPPRSHQLLLHPVGELVRGRVIDEDQRPVVGARLMASTSLASMTTTTDDAGGFLFFGQRRGGPLVLDVDAGESFERRAVDVAIDESSVRVELRSRQKVRGRVLLPGDIDPSRFRVTLCSLDGDERSRKVGADGCFEFRPREGGAILTMLLGGCARPRLTSMEVDVAPGASVDAGVFDLRDMVRSAEFAFTDEAGRALRRVWILDASGDGRVVAMSRADGVVELLMPTVGAPFVAAKPGTRAVEFSLGSPVQMTLRPGIAVGLHHDSEDRGLHAELEPLDVAGLPSAWAARLIDDRDAVASSAAEAHADARFRVPGPGRYRARWKRGEETVAELDIEVAEPTDDAPGAADPQTFIVRLQR